MLNQSIQKIILPVYQTFLHLTGQRCASMRADLVKFKINVSPNPFSSVVNVLYQLDKQETVPMWIYDAVGRAVKTIQTTSSSGVNALTILGMDHLPAKTYKVEMIVKNIHYQENLF